MTLHLADYDVDLPLGRLSFEEFRRWTLSDAFPERGRFDFLNGQVEADLSPEKLYWHNKPKGAVFRTISRAEERDQGEVFSDGARVVVEAVGLSCEPDVVFVSHASFDAGRTTLDSSEDDPDDALEIIGPPDLVVEVISPSSVRKDTVSLYSLYYQAGVREYWLIDARGDDVSFRLLTPGDADWTEVIPDTDGFRQSAVLEKRYRLDRHRGRRDEWRYDLLEREPV